MYTTYFIIGFVTSFGWWSAGKIQKAVDSTSVEIRIETKTIETNKLSKNIEQ
jgi:hypothetical protein